jgi:hypothetical protein
MAENPHKNQIDETKRLIGALLRMPPKPHSAMKLGKPKGKLAKSRQKKASRAAFAKPKTASR